MTTILKLKSIERKTGSKQNWRQRWMSNQSDYWLDGNSIAIEANAFSNKKKEHNAKYQQQYCPHKQIMEQTWATAKTANQKVNVFLVELVE